MVGAQRAAFAQEHPTPELLLRADLRRKKLLGTTRARQTSVWIAPNITAVASARILVGAGHRQHWHMAVRDPGIAPGDQIRGAVWVRHDQIKGSGGAYFALEYLDTLGKRCGISHSKINPEQG